MSSVVSSLAGIVLASGLSRRFGPENKLLHPLHGRPIVRRTVEAYLAARLDPVLVVVGHEGERVLEALEGLPILPVSNPDFARGQSQSLVAAVRALPVGTEAAVIGVGDQPFLTPQVISLLAATYRSSSAALAIPRYAGVRGNPVLFSASLFPELATVQGDQGGRSVLRRHMTEAVWVDIPDARPGYDIDTPEDLAQFAR